MKGKERSRVKNENKRRGRKERCQARKENRASVRVSKVGKVKRDVSEARKKEK